MALVGRMAAAIETEKLCRDFGPLKALDSIELSVERGDSFALLGPNGAGKTTLTRVMGTLLRPSSGSARVLGHDVVEEPDEVRRRIGVVSHESLLYPELTAAENLRFYGNLYRCKEARVEELLGFAHLEGRDRDPVSNLSRGMRQRISIARALLPAPELLILDEPTAGLDVQSRDEFFAMIRGENGKGTTVLFTTHRIDEAEKLCRSAAVLKDGKLLAQGRIDGLKKAGEGLEEAFARITGGTG